MKAAADDVAAPIPNATIRICALPMEMIELIAGFLSPIDLSHLRSTCRTLCAKTMYKFGQTCLSTVHTDLSYLSLQRLYELSQNVEFRPHVCGLRISALPGTVLGDGFCWTRASRTGVLELPHLQPGVRALRRALHYLPKCTTFIVCIEHHDNSINRYKPAYLGPSDVITIILDSVAKTDLSVTSFHIDLKTNRPRGAFLDSSRLLTECISKHIFMRNWASVRTLQLHHSVDSRGVAQWATQLIQRSHCLNKLDIDFDLGSKAGIMIRDLSKSKLLAPIRDLRLSSPSSLKGADLLALLRRFCKCLRTLYLHHVFIRGLAWREIITALKDEFPDLVCVNFFRLGCASFPIVPFPSLDENLLVKGPQADRFAYRSNQRGFVDSFTPTMQAALGALLDNGEFF
ncbi:hypothetical protein P170DRAFT_467962 [Aspergillus steynii IBT 23096]|uniref:F-box domain-containing protein n=1 Tax=Aspergillus steynii IBT 23096 TaxID=1392250 RepID=A0A2I2FUE4_9EURO|nr:uncharacterized protein P170DRAFT_467962 [Aspergillus steynii IBT 23096]PLB44242.1 hypothetical protein P170DRAFT_467962 [Aspergillus steynii IBT 23096]